jgi:hypothetical protein
MKRKAQTECRRGHPWTEGNTIAWTDSAGRARRACRKCHVLACRRSYRRRKSEALARRKAARYDTPPAVYTRASKTQAEFNRAMKGKP